MLVEAFVEHGGEVFLRRGQFAQMFGHTGANGSSRHNSVSKWFSGQPFFGGLVPIAFGATGTLGLMFGRIQVRAAAPKMAVRMRRDATPRDCGHPKTNMRHGEIPRGA
jgi:hypothetical protein